MSAAAVALPSTNEKKDEKKSAAAPPASGPDAVDAALKTPPIGAVSAVALAPVPDVKSLSECRIKSEHEIPIYIAMKPASLTRPVCTSRLPVWFGLCDGDESKAVAQARAEAKLKSPPALCNLGVAQLFGLGGVARDEKAALKSFASGGAAGSAVAQSNAAVLVCLGMGGVAKPDPKSALGVWKSLIAAATPAAPASSGGKKKKSGGASAAAAAAGPAPTAEQKLAGALGQTNIARVYWIGIPPIEEDEAMAVQLFSDELCRDDPVAQRCLAWCLTNSSSDGVKQNPKRAIELYTSAAAKGDVPSLMDLGVAYANGSGVKTDLKVAVSYYEKAARGGHAEAQANYALALKQGDGMEKADPKASEYWYERSAENGFAESQYQMGVICTERKEMKLAAGWYARAALQDHSSAQMNLGFLYGEGCEGLTKNLDTSLMWYTRASEAGNSDAQCALGLLYSSGYGGQRDPDPKLAVKWLMKAMKSGNPRAPKALASLMSTGKADGSGAGAGAGAGAGDDKDDDGEGEDMFADLIGEGEEGRSLALSGCHVLDSDRFSTHHNRDSCIVWQVMRAMTVRVRAMRMRMAVRVRTTQRTRNLLLSNPPLQLPLPPLHLHRLLPLHPNQRQRTNRVKPNRRVASNSLTATIREHHYP